MGFIQEKIKSYQDEVVSAIKAGRREVIIIPVAAVTIQSIEMVLCPLPGIAKQVMKSKLIGWVHIDRLQSNQSKITIQDIQGIVQNKHDWTTMIKSKIQTVDDP